jgi:hypothetical protein
MNPIVARAALFVVITTLSVVILAIPYLAIQ